MIEEFAEKIMNTLMEGMSAVTKEGNPDYKTRVSASKQSVEFFAKIIDGMTPSQKEELSKTLSDDMIEKIKKSNAEEEKYKELLKKRKDKRHGKQNPPNRKRK